MRFFATTVTCTITLALAGVLAAQTLTAQTLTAQTLTAQTLTIEPARVFMVADLPKCLSMCVLNTPQSDLSLRKSAAGM